MTIEASVPKSLQEEAIAFSNDVKKIPISPHTFGEEGSRHQCDGGSPLLVTIYYSPANEEEGESATFNVRAHCSSCKREMIITNNQWIIYPYGQILKE